MDVIFDRHYRLVMQISLKILRDTGEAQDVCQVVFTDFYRQAKGFDPSRGSLKSWLAQYAYGRSINSLRRLKARGHYEQQEIDEISPAPCFAECKLFDLDFAEARRLVEQVLSTVPERQRDVIERICFEGMTLREVAEATGESLGNIQHAYYRGIEKLRKLLVGDSGSKKRSSKSPDGMMGRGEKGGSSDQDVVIVKSPSL
jgi:RNA polymerase sigma-70 factor (ECF subfamily)